MFCPRWKGYLGIIKLKTDGKKDGVAILWKKDKFVLRNSDLIEYGIRGGVGLVACLSHVTTPEVAPEQRSEHSGNVSIANTHLFWNPEFEYLKLLQSQMFLHCAAQLVAQAFETRSMSQQVDLLSDVQSGKPG